MQAVPPWLGAVDPKAGGRAQGDDRDAPQGLMTAGAGWL